MLYGDPGEEGEDERILEELAGSKGWRDLYIYRSAHQLGLEAHRLSLSLPKYELYETGSQLRRAAKAVSANIVEGYGRRRYKAEFVRFLIFSAASLDEAQEHLHYICDCHPDVAQSAASVLRTATRLGASLHRFIASVETNHHP